MFHHRELSGEAWQAALRDSQPVFLPFPKWNFLNVERRNQIYFLPFVNIRSTKLEWHKFAGILLVDENLVSQPRFGRTFPENRILLATKLHLSILFITWAPGWIRDLRPVPPGSLRLCSILESGPSAICVLSASQIIRFPHVWACYIGNSQLCQTFPENADIFCRIQSRQKTLLRCPKLETGFSPCFRLWGPAPSLFVASTAAPFESKALQPRAGRWPPRSAAACHLRWFPGPRQRRCQQSCGNAELHSFNRQTNNEYFGLKAKYIYKHIEQVQGISSTTLIRFPHIICILQDCDHCSRHVSHVFGVENSQLCQTFPEKCKSFNPGKAFWGA